MSLSERLRAETQYYSSKHTEVEKEVDMLERKVSDDEVFLDSVLDEIDVGENLLKKLQELSEGENGRS